MLLRDELQMAVAAVETRCIETADRYADAAGRADDTDLAALFERLAQQRRQLAADMAVQIRALDDLPQSPDPDREAVEHVLTGLKALFSGNARASLIDECERAEKDLMEAAHAALRHAAPPGTVEVLQRILAHSEEAVHELATARAARGQ